MDIFKIVAIALITLILSLVIKQVKPDFAIFVSLAGGCIIFLMIINMLTSVFAQIGEMTRIAGVDGELFNVLIKIIGIGYITEFAADVCNDAQNASLAHKIQLAGKITILFLALPIFRSIFNIIAGLIA